MPDWLSWDFWANDSQSLNHLALIIAGVIGIPLLAIRTFAANRSARAALEQAKAANQSAAAAFEQAKTAAERHDEQTRADRERRITESFAKAVEQLGSDKLETRLGAIYTLERIARESEREYWPIMETLTAFVRERAPWRDETDRDSDADEGLGNDAPIRPATVIQAVLTVLGETCKQDQTAKRRLNLARTDLRGTDLEGAHLKGAILAGASLQGANLVVASLQGADLVGAHLQGAILEGAHLQDTDLEGAHLQGADLGAAHLQGADLRGALGLTQEQLESAFGDDQTQLPDGLTRPAHWSTATPAPDNLE